jgi:enoyl-CoA hydratase/carnithine racemase
VRIASSAGRYGLPEVKVGVPYPQAAIGIVEAELAPDAARVLALGARLVDAAECVRLGVFDETVEPERVLPRALEVASELCRRTRTREQNRHCARRTSCASAKRRRWIRFSTAGFRSPFQG